MRFLLLAALAALACRGERAAGPLPSTGRARTEAAAPGISDAELVAFVRWQREFNELMSRQKAEIDAASEPDLSKPFDQAAREAGERAGQVSERYGPAKRDLYSRLPLQDAKLQLATEAVGGLFHWAYSPAGAQLVVARDEERIGAARRQFGQKAVDDILAREPLIMAELQRP
ncbi:MAG TPA: hypothetical protein VFK70_17805 [Vicinamibacteria bacterium]|nr:hypothetical protein [Vicinamibacteria bacterium]